MKLAWIVLFAHCAPAWKPPTPPPQIRDRAERDLFLSQLGEMIARNILRHDTSHPIFHGCIDWHSAVHGHFALLRISRATGDRRFAELAERALDPQKLEREATTLRQNRYFEMPYGRAWFLRLAIEHARTTGNERLRKMADEVALSLLDFYREYPPTPFSREYSNASWALAQLAAYFRFTGDSTSHALVETLVRQRFMGPGGSFAGDASTPEFFSEFGNWLYLVAEVEDADTLAAFLNSHPVSDAALRPVEKLLPHPHAPSAVFHVAAHHLGMNWSRAWALRRLSLVAPEPERQRFHDAFLAHVQVGIRDHLKYAGDFHSYGHWVPQFAVYALTEDLDR
jgi:hypothetical protein